MKFACIAAHTNRTGIAGGWTAGYAPSQIARPTAYHAEFTIRPRIASLLQAQTSERLLDGGSLHDSRMTVVFYYKMMIILQYFATRRFRSFIELHREFFCFFSVPMARA